jgi:hypothetical protein
MHDIDLRASAIPTEVDVRIKALVEESFKQLRYDEGLEEVTAIRMNERLLARLDAEEQRCEARTEKYRFGHLTRRLPKVPW